MSAIGTRLLKVKIGASEFTAQCTKLTITPEDSDGPATFAEAAAGGSKAWKLKGTALQDPETTSLWYQVWSNPGTSVAVVVNPQGVATATATTPFMSGNAIISAPDGDFVGGEANASQSARNTFDFEMVFTAKPTLVTTGSF